MTERLSTAQPMKKVKMLVVQLFLTLCDPMDCRPPGSSVHGILQARILEWVAIPFSRGSSPPRNGLQAVHITSACSFMASRRFSYCSLLRCSLIDDQSKFDAWNRALKAGALGQPRGMGWGGRWKRGSGWGTHVHPWWIHVTVWQNPPQYCKVISLQLK